MTDRPRPFGRPVVAIPIRSLDDRPRRVRLVGSAPAALQHPQQVPQPGIVCLQQQPARFDTIRAAWPTVRLAVLDPFGIRQGCGGWFQPIVSNSTKDWGPCPYGELDGALNGLDEPLTAPTKDPGCPDDSPPTTPRSPRAGGRHHQATARRTPCPQHGTPPGRSPTAATLTMRAGTVAVAARFTQEFFQFR